MFIDTLKHNIQQLFTIEVGKNIVDSIELMDQKHYDALVRIATELSNAIWRKTKVSVSSESDGDFTSPEHCQWMLSQVVDKQLDDSLKARAWVSYVQGIAVAMDWIDPTEMIDEARDAFVVADNELKGKLDAKLSCRDSVSTSGMEAK